MEIKIIEDYNTLLQIIKLLKTHKKTETYEFFKNSIESQTSETISVQKIECSINQFVFFLKSKKYNDITMFFIGKEFEYYFLKGKKAQFLDKDFQEIDEYSNKFFIWELEKALNKNINREQIKKILKSIIKLIEEKNQNINHETIEKAIFF